MIRALALILTLVAGPALPHGLPDSTVILQAAGQGVRLTLTLPLPELDLAMAGGSGLEPMPGPVLADKRDRLADYLTRHVVLTDAGGPVVLQLSSARVQTAEDHHAGRYPLVIAELAATTARFPLRLTHDAILHEVRSHRVRIFVQIQGQAPLPLALLRLEPGGKPPEVEIEALP